ncbi:winged helix-turn-helix domain-containing protein [Streptomyces sp. CBMA156]|uniref:winged helix-turn-helix domain-containing protein n=1 Tax=Streptomyces sp. CBMA156 TaxID=1930280 RepID=UPI001661AE30|nr:transcriptional regulator [Streptomyces sp. CBMA156]MBD0673530.1 MarR family transcriptional regulator [Streptomyces sp. CBMA156]
MSEHPTSSLDDVVHQRVRLGILAVSKQARRVEFTFLRGTLGLTAGNLSQHLAVLEKAGLVTIDKGYEGKRARTWIELTKAGRKALNDEIAALKTLIHQLEGPAVPAGRDGQAAPLPGTTPAPG